MSPGMMAMDWLTIIYAVIFIGIFVLIHFTMVDYVRRPLTDSEYLAHLAAALECSERDLFILGAREWQLTEKRADEDFQRYVKDDELPHYMNDLVRRLRAKGIPGILDKGYQRKSHSERPLPEELASGKPVDSLRKDRVSKASHPDGEWPGEKELLKETAALLMILMSILMICTFIVRHWDQPSAFEAIEKRVAMYNQMHPPPDNP